MFRQRVTGSSESRRLERRLRVDSEPQQTSPKELNEHIYELYKPNGQPAMEILFFHGLQLGDNSDSYLSTWTTGNDSQEVWPRTWLAEEFPTAHIFVVSYDSSVRVTQKEGRFDMFNVVENLMHAICLANIGQGFLRPVILVGHSFGGLVMKQLCVTADQIHSRDPDEGNEKIGKFIRNVGGLFFYGTPHRGIRLPEAGGLLLDSPLLVYVKLLSAEAARLDTEFDSVSKKYKVWRIAGVGESHETSWGPFKGLVVPEASARYGGDFSTIAADHISLCKPDKKTSNSFQRLINFIPKVQKEARFENIQLVPKAAVGLDFAISSFLGFLKLISGRRCHLYAGPIIMAHFLFLTFYIQGRRTSLQQVQKEARFENIQHLPKAAVGLDFAVENVLKKWQDRTTVGIFGMGGVGKTTLAKALFNKLGPTLECSCFVDQVKLVKGEVEGVKEEVLKHIYCDGKKISSKEGGWSKLRGKQLLLVLDDVACDRDIELLSSIASVVDVKSRFIVTSRDREILRNLDDIELYEVPFLSEIDAKGLFLSYTFPNQTGPSLVLERHVDTIVKKCEGLPLTLEVLGKYLKGQQNGKVWEQTLEVLDSADSVSKFDERLWEKLRPSYTGLGEKAKHMFLDSTTFFSDTRRTLSEAKAAWGVVYGSELLLWQDLVQASLVYDVQDDEPIKVHDQLKSLGRRIASEDVGRNGKQRRVWKATDGWKSLQFIDDDQEIHSLRLLEPEKDQVIIPRSSFRRLKKLQYLDVHEEAFERVSIDGAQRNETLRTDLVLLRSPGLQFGQVPFAFPLQRLAVLDLTRYEDQSLPSSFGQLLELKILKISDASSLKTLPNSIGGLRKLEHLQLFRCPRLTMLPQELGSLSHLRYFKCVWVKLRALPLSFGELSALNHLELGSEDLQTLPESFGRLSALNHLVLASGNLQNLPESFGGLFALNHLELISYSGELQTLPESFGGLSALNYLKLASDNLQSLPESFCGLSALNHLTLEAKKLQTLPESFGRLSALNHLTLESKKLQTLPRSFGGLSALNHLTFVRCAELQALPESFGQLSGLSQIKFIDCPKLQILPWKSFGQLAHLDHLELIRCPMLAILPDSFSELKVLRHLKISLVNFTSIPDCIRSLPSLQILELGFLPYLKELPPWLGERLPVPPQLSQRFLRTPDGDFALECDFFATTRGFQPLSWQDEVGGKILPTLLYP